MFVGSFGMPLMYPSFGMPSYGYLDTMCGGYGYSNPMGSWMGGYTGSTIGAGIGTFLGGMAGLGLGGYWGALPGAMVGNAVGSFAGWILGSSLGGNSWYC